MQDLINHAEAQHNAQSYLDADLIKHLDGQAHPMPHPPEKPRIHIVHSTFGHPIHDQANGRMHRTHPGPITMSDKPKKTMSVIVYIVVAVVAVFSAAALILASHAKTATIEVTK
jgi:hypothetical protein